MKYRFCVSARPTIRVQTLFQQQVHTIAMERAKEKGQDPNTIWTEGSKLGSGSRSRHSLVRRGGEVRAGGSVAVSRRGFCTAGKRRERRVNTYQDQHRSFEKVRSGWRTAGFGMGGGREAYDAELAALVYGLVHLLGRRVVGRAYTIFTDSTVAMMRIVSDAPGPGREMAIRVIELAQRVVDQGNSITVRWALVHRGVEGNERTDQAAEEMASLPPLRATTRRFSLAFLRRRATERQPGRGERISRQGTQAEGHFVYQRRHRGLASDPS